MRTVWKRTHISWSRLLGLAAAVLAAAILTAGCSLSADSKRPQTREEILAEMREFTVKDGTAGIYLDSDWEEQDVESETFLGAVSEDGSEGVLLMQFPKDGRYGVFGMEEMQERVEEVYHITNAADAEVLEVPGLSDIMCMTGDWGESESEPEGRMYLVYGESDYAYYAIAYMAAEISDEILTRFAVSCSAFWERVPEEEDASTAEVTDTVRWFNAACAVLTQINGWDYGRFGGLPANDTSRETVRELLEQWWDVTDLESANETLTWILEEGHRKSFVEEMQYLEDAGISKAEDRIAFLLENFEVTDEEAAFYAEWYEAYETGGENTIAGWDYCRALTLTGQYYIAGYDTEEEALDRSLEIALTLQPMFDSWDALMDSYMTGYEYWAEESAAPRREIYEELKKADDNPYEVDYLTELEKTW